MKHKSNKEAAASADAFCGMLLLMAFFNMCSRSRGGGPAVKPPCPTAKPPWARRSSDPKIVKDKQTLSQRNTN